MSPMQWNRSTQTWDTLIAATHDPIDVATQDAIGAIKDLNVAAVLASDAKRVDEIRARCEDIFRELDSLIQFLGEKTASYYPKAGA